MIRLLAAAFFVIAVNGADCHVLSQRPEPNPFDKLKIGVLRASGAIVPFAEYYRHQWWNPWPEKSSEFDEDQAKIKSLGNHAEPWFLGCDANKAPWYSSTAEGRGLVLAPMGLTELNNHGGDNWAILTNMPNRTKFDPDVNHDDIGFALSGNIPIEQMIEVKTDSNEAVWFLQKITPVFANVETDEINQRAAEKGTRVTSPYEIPFSAEERALTKIKITDLLRSGSSINGRDLYFVSMQKEYGKSPDSGEFACGGEVYFLYAWVFKNNNGDLVTYDVNSGITDCDGKVNPSPVMRFASFRLGDRTFIATIEHGYEDEEYVIYEVVGDQLLKALETFGGGL